tara:strand:+ start:86 stop:862 length:777 start_codon:yes stop_codon:yes gene_type:complete
MNTNINEYLEDLQLGIGESKRFNCPFCSGYKTFTVTNNMGKLLWNCYKSSCKLSGAKKIRISASDIKNKFMTQKEHENAIFKLPEYVILDNDRWEVLCFAVKYGIDNVKLCLHYDVKEKRVVFPVYKGGLMVDGVGRSITGRLPKWKRYGNSDLPFTYGYGNVAVVVEDCVSASVVGSEVYVGVAVLGTSLSESHKRYLSQFSTAIIALDPDALPKTLLFAKEIRDVVPNVKVLKLTDDLKYRKDEDFRNLYNLTPKE